MADMVTRFGASVDTGLLQHFDKLARAKGYTNRSEVIRDLMREFIVANEWNLDDKRSIGTVTLVYNHHAVDLSERLTSIQHDYHAIIISTLHIHLDCDNCLEVIIVKGHGKQLEEVANALITAKGVLLGRLVVTAVDGLL